MGTFSCFATGVAAGVEFPTLVGDEAGFRHATEGCFWDWQKFPPQDVLPLLITPERPVMLLV